MKHAIQCHWKVVALLTLITLATPLLLLCTSTLAQVKKPIAKDGLIEAIRLKGFSTKELVERIKARGVSFQMSPEIEAEMQSAGASPEVIEAARANYRLDSPFDSPSQLAKGTGVLTINSNVTACKVLVNGKLRGLTSESGMFTLPPLKAGAYKVALKKENYEDQEHPVQIVSGAYTTENFALMPHKGLLTVIPNIGGASVYIRNVEYPDAVRNLSLAPDDYEVRVSKSGYRTVTRVVTIAPGLPLTIPITLEVMKVEDMLAQAADALRQKNFVQTITICREILAAKPDEPKANLLLGLGYFNLGNYEPAVGSLVKAISLGEQVAIPLQHHTKYGIVNDNLTPGLLIVAKNLLEFRTLAGSALFSVPLDKVYRILPEDNRGGRIQIKVGNPAKKKDGGKDYNFHPMQAGLRPVVVGNSVTMSIYCQNCLPTAQAIYQLVQQVTQSFAHNITLPKP
jgi:hypothetical protein